MKQFQFPIVGLFLSFLTALPLLAQHDHDHNHNQEHAYHDKHPHNHEISLALGVIPVTESDQAAMALHMHYVKGLGASKRFGLGLGSEIIFDEHKHYTLSLVSHYRIYKGLTFAYAPGILFVEEEGESETLFAQHLELAYEFVLGRIHLGPIVDFAWDRHGEHYMAGVHIGTAF